MTQQKHIKTRQQLLHDSSFIQWSLAPTDESDNVWNDYLQRYPEEKENLEQARNIIRSARLNRYTLSAEEKQALKQSIRRDATLLQAKKRRLTWQYAAACLLAVCISGTVWLMQKRTDINQTDANLIAHTMQIDTTQTEVELQLSTQEKVQITDKATIRVNEEGTIQVSEEAIKTANTPEEENYFAIKINTLTVPKGRHSSVILADGSKVWVNSGTILRFPEQFDKDKRTIYVEGEIYLEVTKDASRPFYVKTSQMDVRVLGTSFNVTAYKEDTEQAVILKEGSVSVDNRSGKERVIKPNEMLVLNDNQMSVSQVNPDDYISWISGVLQFSGKNLDDILQRLSRYYRVQFECTPSLRNRMCSGKLVLFDNVEQVLRTLEESFSISYEINGNVITLNTDSKKDSPMR